MKKLRIFAFVLALVLALAPVTVFAEGEETPKYEMDPAHLTFRNQDDLDAIVYRHEECTVEIADGELKATCADLGSTINKETGLPIGLPDPRVYVSLKNLASTIQAEDYPYCAMIYRLPTASTSNRTEIFFNTNDAGARGGQSVKAGLTASQKYNYTLFNCGSLSEWNGVVTSIRLDFFDDFPSNGDTLYIRDIVFYADEASAKAGAQDIVDDLNLPDEMTLSFVVGDHGTAPEDQKVKKKECPVRPEDPVSNDGYVFDNWYTTKTFRTVFDFDVPLNKEKVIVYAKWVKGFVVTFDCGEGVEAPAAQTVKQNGRAVEPDIPERDGFTFRGWYADKDLTEEFDFGAIIKEDTVVYAKWEEGAATRYSITVTGGTADKESAVAGSKITVTADAVEENYVFDHWDITGAIEFTNSDDSDGKSASFTFILGENDVSLEAIFVSTFEYTIEVENGTADKESARAGTVVTVTAAEPEEGMRFDHWEIEGLLEFMNEPDKLGKNASFSFRMCECNVKLTAVFTDASAVIPGDVNGDGKLNAKDVTAIMKYLVNAAPANFVEAAADYDGSGTINAKDVTKLMKYLVANPS